MSTLTISLHVATSRPHDRPRGAPADGASLHVPSLNVRPIRVGRADYTTFAHAGAGSGRLTAPRPSRSHRRRHPGEGVGRRAPSVGLSFPLPNQEVASGSSKEHPPTVRASGGEPREITANAFKLCYQRGSAPVPVGAARDFGPGTGDAREAGTRHREGGRSLRIEVVDNQIEPALKALKREMLKGGVFKEMKRRAFYEKPSVKRKRKQAEARKKRRKAARRSQPDAD